MSSNPNPDEIDIKKAALPWNAAQPKSSRIIPPYLRGPIPWDWLRNAAKLGGGSLPTGLALWHLRTLNRSHSIGASLKQLCKITGLSEKVTREGLHRLENVGLIEVHRPPGRKPTITLGDHAPGCPPQTHQAEPTTPANQIGTTE